MIEALATLYLASCWFGLLFFMFAVYVGRVIARRKSR